MTWPWAIVIVAMLLFVFGMSYLNVWRANNVLAIQTAKEMQMRGPLPFWMTRAPQTLEEAVEAVRQMAEQNDPPDAETGT